MIFFTSDLHFFHENVIKYSKRPFQNATEMNDKLILNWNNEVKKGDIVYLLGDVSFGKKEDTKDLLHKLNGEIHLILGNHDKLSKMIYTERFKTIKDYTELRINGIFLIMSHFPFLSWNCASYGSFMLHGHSHNSFPVNYNIRRIDVGVDTELSNYMPISIDKLKIEMNKYSMPVVDHHGGEI